MALARWIAAVGAGRPIRILGSPARTRDVTDVRDLVRAVRLAAERGVNGPLNVGTGHPRTLADLAAAVCRVLGAPAELVLAPATAVEPAATWADTTRLRRTLGFVPVTDLDELVARQVAALPEPTARQVAAAAEPARRQIAAAAEPVRRQVTALPESAARQVPAVAAPVLVAG
jgi:nucleoside-diphosphate-sugar epimerase